MGLVMPLPVAVAQVPLPHRKVEAEGVPVALMAEIGTVLELSPAPLPMNSVAVTVLPTLTAPVMPTPPDTTRAPLVVLVLAVVARQLTTPDTCSCMAT
jgi:hypothetical protein